MIKLFKRKPKLKKGKDILTVNAALLNAVTPIGGIELIVISQSVVDFLDPCVKMYGQALMDLPAYKIITGTDGQNLIELSKLYNFTEAERDRMETAPKEYALFMIGNLRIFVHFDIPAYKMEYIGKGGGR